MAFGTLGVRVLSMAAALGLAAGMLALQAAPAEAVTCPTVNPVTHAVSPAPAPGVDWNGCDLTNADLQGADLAGASIGATFTGANLTRANLSGADLTAAYMVSANLTDANLSDVTLYVANLTGATLTGVQSGGISAPPEVFLPTDWFLTVGYLVGPGADLAGASMNEAGLGSADLTGTDFNGAVLTGSDLSSANLTDADLKGANLSRSSFYLGTLTDANLNSANLTDTSLFGATLTGTDLAGTTLTGVTSGGITGTPASLPADWALRDLSLVGPGADLYEASLYGGDLSETDLAGANLSDAYLGSSNLTGTDLSGANLTGASMASADLARANLTGATVTGAILTGVIWSDTTCPDGTNSSQYTAGCFSTRLYGFRGFTAPKPGSMLAKSSRTITAKFQLTTTAGRTLSQQTGSSLAAGHSVQVTIRGPHISKVTSACTWDKKHQAFRCAIQTPATVRTGKSHRYSVTATENLGTGFLLVPASATTVNPETIYFK